MWIGMFAGDLVIPVIILIMGIIFKNNTPKKINRSFGYRTRLSMRNQETWDYANAYLGKLWTIAGLVMLIAAILIMVMVKGAEEATVITTGGILMVVEAIIIIFTALAVNNGLKKNFDKDGNRI